MRLFSERLDKLLNEAAANGRPKVDVARAAGISPNRLHNYVGSMREPSYEVLSDLCRALGTSPNYLMGFTDDPKWPPEETTMADLAAKMDALLKSQK